jgi:hypothetical protein
MNATEAEGSAAQALHRQASLAATQGLITQEEKAHIQEQLEVAAAEEGGGGGGGEEEEDGASRSSSSISSISNMSNTSNRSNSSSNGSNFGVPPKLPVSLRKRRAHSTGPIASYEVRRMTKHRTVFGQQGRLRRFWRRVQRHQSGQLLVVERIAKFVRDRATVQHHFAVALDKLAAGGSSLKAVAEPRVGMDVTCNELLEAEGATAKWMRESAKRAIKDICKNGLEKLVREYKSACSTFGKRALRVSKDIDAWHTAVLKAHRTYLKCFEATMSGGSGGGGSSGGGGGGSDHGSDAKLAGILKERAAAKPGGACLWMAETSYTRTAKMYESTCATYRSEMSKLYLEYQKLELDRVTRLRALIKQFILIIRDSLAGAAGDGQVVCALAAIEELDPQREVVMGLNQLNVPQSGSNTTNNKSGDAPSRHGGDANAAGAAAAAASADGAAGGGSVAAQVAAAAERMREMRSADNEKEHAPIVPPPPPMQSRLILKSGTIMMKSGLLRSWKPFHGVLTADSYLHLFDAAALLERGATTKLPPTYEPFLTIDALASTAAALPETHAKTFELTTNSTGFLGMKSQKKQEFRTERESQVGSWISAFERVKRAHLAV